MLRYLLFVLVSLPALAFADEAVSQVPWAEIIPVVGTVLALLITWGGKLLRELIKSKVKNETLNGVLFRAAQEVEEIVLHAEQELRPSFQKKLEDGKLDDEEKKALKAEVLAIFKDSIAWGDFVSIAFGGNKSEAEAKANRSIDASVAKMKIAGGPSVDPTVGSPEA